MIDEFHALGHSNCSLNYNTSQFKSRGDDFSLAEQQNKPISELKNSFAYMDQGSFLLMLRFKLFCANTYQLHHSKNSDVVFWKAPPKRFVIQHGGGVDDDDGGGVDDDDDVGNGSIDDDDDEDEVSDEEERETLELWQEVLQFE